MFTFERFSEIFNIAIIIIIIIITDLYSAFRSEDTEALDAAQHRRSQRGA